MIKENTFAASCYDMNTAEELRAALAGEVDETDCKLWGLTAEEWREQIKLALAELQDTCPVTDQPVESCGCNNCKGD